jgi:hypothetical protein
MGDEGGSMPDANRNALEELTRDWLKRFAHLQLWNSVESLRSFVEVLTPCIVNKMEPELSNALRKGRVEDLGLKTCETARYSWLAFSPIKVVLGRFSIRRKRQKNGSVATGIYVNVNLL